MSSITRSAVEAMDARDPLASCRARFALPSNVVYLDGNSLGALPVTTPARLGQVVEAWGRDLIRSWNGHDWIGWPKRVGDRIADRRAGGRGDRGRFDLDQRLQAAERCARSPTRPLRDPLRDRQLSDGPVRRAGTRPRARQTRRA